MHVRWVVLAALIGMSFALVGCGDDDSSADAGMDADDDDSSVTEDDFVYADVPAPYADNDVAACQAFVEADEGLEGDHSARRDCFCEECFDLMRQCDALPGCSEMRRCAWESGCRTPQSCYLLPGAPCRDVIDRWGNGSVSAALNTELGMCSCE